MNFRKLVLGMGILGVLAMPVVVMADAFNFNVDINGDDQAHFDFKAGPHHHHPEIWKAAKQLQMAKHDLWKAADDYHGHKADAVMAINAALDQLKVCEQQ